MKSMLDETTGHDHTLVGRGVVVPQSDCHYVCELSINSILVVAKL